MGNEYIVNGEVSRDKIAMDIKYRKLSRDRVIKICNNPQVKAAFIGSKFSNKRPKQAFTPLWVAMAFRFSILATRYHLPRDSINFYKV